MGAMLACAWFYISSIFINDRQHDDKDVSSTDSNCHIAVKRSTGSCPAYLGEKNLVFFHGNLISSSQPWPSLAIRQKPGKTYESIMQMDQHRETNHPPHLATIDNMALRQHLMKSRRPNSASLIN